MSKEISSTSEQQLTAVNQTTEAIGNIKTASQQQGNQTREIEKNITNLHKVSETLDGNCPKIFKTWFQKLRVKRKMGSEDPEFQKQLLEIFKSEAEEHIEVLTNYLLELEKDFQGAATEEKLETVYREAHSLKGAARAVGLDAIQNICQILEKYTISYSFLISFQPTKEYFQVGFEALDYIKTLVQKPRRKARVS